MEEDSGILTLAKQGSITFIGNVVGKLIGFLFIIVVTRLVTPSVYGLFTLGVAVVSFVQGVSSLNLYRSIDYFLPKQLADEDFDQAKSTLVSVLTIGIILASIGYGILIVTSPLISETFDEPAITTVIPLLGVAIPLLTIEQSLLATFNSIKQLKFRVYTKNFIYQTVKLLGSVILVLLGADVFGLVSAYLLAILLSVVTGVYLLVSTQRWLRQGQFEMINIRRITSYSVPLMFAGIIYAFLGQVDYFVIGYFMASSDVGVYKIGYSLAANLLIVLSAITPVFKPMVSERSDDLDLLQSRYRLATRWVTMATLPIAITLIAAPETYLSILFTSEYASASTALVILVIGFLLNASFGPEGMMFEGLGYTRLTFVNTVVLITSNTALDIVFVPRFGIAGAAIGTATGLTVAGVLGVVEIRVLKGLHPYSKNLLKLWLASVPVVALAILISPRVVPPLLFAVVLPFVVVITYAGSIIVFQGFTEDDIKIAKKVDDHLNTTILASVVSIGKS